ncbi:hypothetical protein IW261DRAFT_1589852 [Armillaria novae-zelandiae]|uniref:Uncharacterized protein n=1 Tax=Armillaria novae-zelandiae TaxID=153914 RepID=A0AA39UPR2_9AGAR|nr:hypothetical protein IW261DRAFT_1589852 [Armillaria novae-zelandiae]
MLSTTSLPTISLTDVNISLPYPILRKRQNASTVTADRIIRPGPGPVKYSARSIFSARRPSEHPGAPPSANTASLSFVNLRSKYQTASIISTDTISRPVLLVKRSAKSILKAKERRKRSQRPAGLTTVNLDSRPSITLGSKNQGATANTYVIARPGFMVKRSAQSIFKAKKPSHSYESDIMTVKQLDDVFSLHPRSEYSRYPTESFPNSRRKFTRSADSDTSLSSESSSSLYGQSQSSSASSTVVSDSSKTRSVLSDSVLSESSRTASAELLNSNLGRSISSACVSGAVLVLPENAVHASRSMGGLKWMMMMLMIVIIGFVTGFYSGDIMDLYAFHSSYLLQ